MTLTRCINRHILAIYILTNTKHSVLFSFLTLVINIMNMHPLAYFTLTTVVD